MRRTVSVSLHVAVAGADGNRGKWPLRQRKLLHPAG
jgi:hypothetical protein